MPEIKKLNMKHKLFCKQIMEGKTQKQAYITAYPNSADISAESSGSRLLSNGKIREECLMLMERISGLNMQDMLLTLKDCTLAKYPIIVKDKIHEYADNTIRLQAVQTGFRILGLMSSNTTHVDNRTVSFNVSPSDIKGLDTILTRLERIEGRGDRISGKIINS